jgi:putative tryptophan/tyrosine transport system substrate-binding protein
MIRGLLAFAVVNLVPCLGALELTSAAAAQEVAVRRVGILYQDKNSAYMMESLRKALGDLGYVEGKTIAFEPRFAAPGSEGLEVAATQLLGSNVEVVVAVGTPAALAVRRMSSTIPIVFVVGDPVASGLVVSLARPGGSSTGVATLAGETGVKRLELLKEVLPHATRIGVMVNPDNPATEPAFKLIDAASQRLNLKLQRLMVRQAEDLDSAFAQGRRQGIDALIIIPDPILNANVTALAQRALKGRVPSAFESPLFAKSSGLISYGLDLRELWQKCAIYTDKILKGAKPSELPIEQPTRYVLVVNLKTAKAFGLTIPESILVRADEVIR